MKWFSVLTICALALLSNACEKHPASELPPEHAPGAHHEEPKVEEAPREAAKPEAEAKPGEAPKFFPEKK